MSANEQRVTLWEALPHECHYCHRQLTFIGSTRDHIVPKALGGTNHIWNQVLACRSCNAGKKQDRVGVCDCPRCTKALNRWRAVRSTSNRRIRSSGGRRSREVRTLDEVIDFLGKRIGDRQSSLDRATDPLIAASMRGYIHGIQTSLDLLRTVKNDDETDEPFKVTMQDVLDPAVVNRLTAMS